MNLTINGDPCEVGARTLAELIQELGSQRGCAAAVDGVVVPRSEWGAFTLRNGQVLEVLKAVQGG